MSLPLEDFSKVIELLLLGHPYLLKGAPVEWNRVTGKVCLPSYTQLLSCLTEKIKSK